MPPPDNLQVIQKLLQELLVSITTLQKEVTTLKADDDHRSYPQKWPCNGNDKNGNHEEEASCNGDNNGNHNSNLDPSEDEKNFMKAGSNGYLFQLSKEGKAFLEATCGSCLEYTIRKSQATT